MSSSAAWGVLFVVIADLLVTGEVRGQGVVAGQRMRPHDQVAHAGIVGQLDGDGRALAPRAALPLEDLAHRVMVRQIFLGASAMALCKLAAPNSSSRCCVAFPQSPLVASKLARKRLEVG